MANSPIDNHLEDEDDWLEPPTQGGASDPLVNQEFNRLSNKFSDAGYREGITDGKLSTLQVGFDEGFEKSVPLSRRVGILRGKTFALLSIISSSSFSSSSLSSSSSSSSRTFSTSIEELILEIRELNSQLSNLKRDNILPEDEEKIKHEKEEHGEGQNDDENGFEFDQNDNRVMESLENALELLGGGDTANKSKEDGEGLVRELEEKLNELEKIVLRR